MLDFERLVSGLEGFDPGDHEVLSLYLRTDPSRDAGRNVKAQLAGLLRPLAESLDDADERARFDAAAARAATLAAGLRWPARATALFVCPPRGLETVLALPGPVAPTARWTDHLHLVPLLAQLDEHERTLVLLVDKARARLFHVCMGQIEELESFEDEVPGKHREGRSLQRAYQGPHTGVVGMGYDAPTIQRHHEWHVRRHIDRVLTSLARADRPALIDRIMVAGPVEATSALLGFLPQRLARRVSGELRVPLNASKNEVLEAVALAGAAVEREAELALVEELLERPGRARLGATAVVEAVANRQVQTLVYAEGVDLVGATCRACDWLLVASEPASPPCPRCAAVMDPVRDLVDVMVSRVLEAGGRVEEVRDEAAARLEGAEGLGALLRWSPSPALAAT